VSIFETRCRSPVFVWCLRFRSAETISVHSVHVCEALTAKQRYLDIVGPTHMHYTKDICIHDRRCITLRRII